ncbi:MAG: response regulator transcription factor [Solirubrobacteraceae bacterium]|nr:response regulator transcription factor [Solirubrobacteraceae bacterium]
MRTILVVEDDELIADAVAARLRAEGFAVELAADGPSGVLACERVAPDLVVLDVMLPGFDGWEVCRRIQIARHVPVLMLTARDSETDLLVGLGLGADDYVTKPFSPRELVARVHAILRRTERTREHVEETVRLGDVEIDTAARRVRRAGSEITLTRTEFDLLVHLLGERGRVCSREGLLEEVWGYADGTGPRTVDSHVAALRRKLGTDVVRTVHGVGYALGVAS